MFGWSSDTDDGAAKLTTEGFETYFFISSVLCNKILDVIQKLETDHIFTRNIQFNEFSMCHAMLCIFVRTLQKERTNHSDILLDKSLMSLHPT